MKYLPRSLRRLPSFFSVVLLLLFCGSNWFVHQSRRWQEEQIQKYPQGVSRLLITWGNAFADITDSLGITGEDVSVSYSAPLSTNSFQSIGLPVRRKGGNAPTDIRILQKTGFTIGYSPALRHPVWVAYRAFPYSVALTPPEERPRGFRSDRAAPRSPKTSDYTRSGYDRGHMAPNLAIAARYGKKAQSETFLLSNICPQRPGLNQGPWCEMEYRTSEIWPAQYGTVWIVVGAISTMKNKTVTGVDIPSAFYQVLLARGKDGNLRALAVYMPQNISRHAYARAHVTSIRQLEEMTGLDFSSALPSQVQEKLENRSPTRLWKSGVGGMFRVILMRYRSYTRKLR